MIKQLTTVVMYLKGSLSFDTCLIHITLLSIHLLGLGRLLSFLLPHHKDCGEEIATEKHKEEKCKTGYLPLDKITTDTDPH